MATEPTLIGEIAVRNVHTVLPESPAIIAAKVMVDNGIRHLVVTDDCQKVLGVLSQRGILKELSPWLSKVKGVTKPEGPMPYVAVEDVMSSPAITVREDDTLQQASSLMAAEKIGCLPVVNGEDKLVGIVSVIDVLRYLSENGNAAPEETGELVAN